LAVLRRAKNVKNASDAERNALLEDAEHLESWSAWLVLYAIVLEVVVWISPLCPLFFKIGNALSDGAVAIGILGEMRFGQIAGNILKIVLAEAVERAANAELETERLRAQFSWRRLAAEQIEKFLAVLADKPKFSIRIEYVGNDPDSNTFAHEIGGLFKKSGWKVAYTSASYPGEVTFGLCVPVYAPPDLDACALVRMALSAASVGFLGGSAPTWFMGSGAGDPVTSPLAHLYVGPKAAPSDPNQLAEAARMSPEEAEKMREKWLSRMKGNEPVMTWAIESPLTITRQDNGTLLIDCRNLRLAGMEDQPGIARFIVSPDAAQELAQYFASLGNRGQ
jgi:hypothetical protein